MKNPWLKRDVAKMRLGQMIPACIHEELPSVFVVKGISIHKSHRQSGDQDITLFCVRATGEERGERLIWRSEKLIEYKGCHHQLIYSPSDREKWCTFTIADPGI